MKKWMLARGVLTALALLLSHVMCAVVAYEYAALVCAGRHLATSAPPELATLWAIPFGVGILLCLGLAWYCKQKAKQAV